jgi:hypothetical protein
MFAANATAVTPRAKMNAFCVDACTPFAFSFLLMLMNLQFHFRSDSFPVQAKAEMQISLSLFRCGGALQRNEFLIVVFFSRACFDCTPACAAHDNEMNGVVNFHCSDVFH